MGTISDMKTIYFLDDLKDRHTGGTEKRHNTIMMTYMVTKLFNSENLTLSTQENTKPSM